MRTEGQAEIYDLTPYPPHKQIEVRVSKDRVEIILRGGPLEPVALTLTGKDIEVEDSWEWGDG